LRARALGGLRKLASVISCQFKGPGLCSGLCISCTILKMSKQEMRKRLAGLSFSEKVKILEQLRDRSLALAASGLRQPVNRQPVNRKSGTKKLETRDSE
jgi:hypothetical protein